jgi:hypothetical protein
MKARNLLKSSVDTEKISYENSIGEKLNRPYLDG